MEFPEIPEDLSTLSTEELVALREEIQKFIAENADEASTEDLEKLAQLADHLDGENGIDAELVKREEAEQAQKEAADALKARVSTEEPETPETEEEESTEEPEAVAAAATPRKRIPAQIRRTPQPVPTSGFSLTAAATGQPLDSNSLSQSLIHAYSGLKAGQEMKVATVTASADLPKLGLDEASNLPLIAAAQRERTEALTKWCYGTDAERESLVAAGGICAPTEGYYDVFTLGDASRPVTNSLVQFGADQGGIRWQTPPTLADIDISGDGAAVGIRTNAQDAEPVDEEFAFKTCQEIACGGDNEAVISALYKCLEFNNFGSRTYPELVTAWTDLAGVAHARLGETVVLDAIAAGSTAVTYNLGDTGAAREILGGLAQVAAGYRSRNRMAPNAVLELQGPAWVRELVIADFARTLGNDGLVLNAWAQWEAALRSLGLAVNWYLDTKTGGGQVFGSQGSGAAVVFPDPKFYFYAPGSWLFLNGGSLDLGVVRDSTLNARNRFQIFSETFEQVAKVGGPSLEISFSTSPTGAYAAAVSSNPEA